MGESRDPEFLKEQWPVGDPLNQREEREAPGRDGQHEINVRTFAASEALGDGADPAGEFSVTVDVVVEPWDVEKEKRQIDRGQEAKEETCRSRVLPLPSSLRRWN